MRTACLAVLVLACTCSLTADEPSTTGKADPSFWMKQKLSHSQSLFQALAEANFDQLAESAAKLATLNKVEEFVRHRNPKYKAQLDIFQYATEELGRQAEKKNIEGAALAFHQLTLSCVNCHRQLRDDATTAR
jgi:cytochrome c556